MGGTLIDQRMIPWKALSLGAQAPLYGSAEAAGGDLHADFISEGGDLAQDVNDLKDPIVTLLPGTRRLFKTGVAIELPPGTYATIKGRSGLALKHGILMLGGTIDSDYRGEIGVILHNLGSEPFQVKHGDRIAQMVVLPYIRAVYELTDKLEGTERGAGAYGSTGV